MDGYEYYTRITERCYDINFCTNNSLKISSGSMVRTWTVIMLWNVKVRVNICILRTMRVWKGVGVLYEVVMVAIALLLLDNVHDSQIYLAPLCTVSRARESKRWPNRCEDLFFIDFAHLILKTLFGELLLKSSHTEIHLIHCGSHSRLDINIFPAPTKEVAVGKG